MRAVASAVLGMCLGAMVVVSIDFLDAASRVGCVDFGLDGAAITCRKLSK